MAISSTTSRNIAANARCIVAGLEPKRNRGAYPSPKQRPELVVDEAHQHVGPVIL